LIINRKSHKRFRLVPKSSTLDDNELTLNGYYALLHYTRLAEATTKIRMEKDRVDP